MKIQNQKLPGPKVKNRASIASTNFSLLLYFACVLFCMCSVNNLYGSICGRNVCDRFGVKKCRIDNFQANVITELY